MDPLLEITILLLAAALAAPVGRYSRVGSVLAFAGVGMLIGPSALALIHNPDTVLNFSEIGVVFLLFIIGLELQPRRLWAMRSVIFGAGSLQVISTALVLAGLAIALGFGREKAIVMGYGLALSSTAFALRLIADNEEMNTAQGRLGFGVLLFQDLAIIPFLALVALLAPGQVPVEGEFNFAWWQSAGIFVVFVVGAHFLLVPFLHLIAWSRVREAFIATALLLVLGFAWVMQAIGLSMGLGAFMAGVLVADSEYRHQLEVDIEPFKALLLGLFFMAVGMATNMGVLVQMPLQVGLGVLLLLAVKLVLLALVGRAYALKRSQALRFAVYLCQGGEFGFVAFTLCHNLGILSAEEKDLLILIITLSMALTPVLLKLLNRLQSGVALDETAMRDILPPDESHPVIIAGFGRFGQILGRVLQASGIRYTAIDRSPDLVHLVRHYGNKVYFGDVSKHSMLERAHVAEARVLALCIDDVEASVEAVLMLKKYYPRLKIFARARNRFHEIRLRELGVDYVIREALLSALEFTQQVLVDIGVQPPQAEALVEEFRTQDHRLLQQQGAELHEKLPPTQSAQQAAEELKRLLQQDVRR
ncbi:MAG TPA: cation:proton antiporter [Hyphomicrobiales bacterium]|nr:cation:proton antiporter [Hyphomicrobiales bacterium]